MWRVWGRQLGHLQLALAMYGEHLGPFLGWHGPARDRCKRMCGLFPIPCLRLVCEAPVCLTLLATGWPQGSCLSICSQFNAFQLKDHLGSNRNAAGWVPLLLAIHPQVTVMIRRGDPCGSLICSSTHTEELLAQEHK